MEFMVVNVSIYILTNSTSYSRAESLQHCLLWSINGLVSL